MDIPAPLSPYLALSAVIHALRGAVWGWYGFFGQALTMLMHRRLGAICSRMERLAVRFQAGRLLVRGPRTVVPVEGVTPKIERAKRIWPIGFGWLLDAKKHHAALYTGQIRTVLESPEMVALLLAAPQAAKILTPLCRMLGIERSVLHPRAPGAPVAVVAEIVVKKRARAKRPKVDWGRIPLPRGVLSAARRQGFGKLPRE